MAEDQDIYIALKCIPTNCLVVIRGKVVKNQTIDWWSKLIWPKKRWICVCVPPDVTFWERHDITYTVFQLEMLISNIIFKEKLDKLKVMIILLKHVIKDKERLWKCSRLKETKERWQLKTVLHLRLDLLLEEKYAIKDIIGSIDKIVIQKVDQRRVSYQC